MIPICHTRAIDCAPRPMAGRGTRTPEQLVAGGRKGMKARVLPSRNNDRTKQKGDLSREMIALSPDFLKIWSEFQTTTKLFRNRSSPAS